jgi:uncharacterized RDD family membrane protein YckC
MICAHCGTLNEDDRPECVHCGRPPFSEGGDMCAVHPDRAASGCCAICDLPLCDECEVRVAGTVYCAAHAEGLGAAEAAPGGLRTTPVLDVSTKQPASFAQRVQAGAIDLILMGVYLMIVYLVLWALSGSPPTDPDAAGWRVVFWLLVVLGPLGYLVYENVDDGQTAGKAATDIIALRADGTLMDAQTGALRGLLSAVSFVVGGIGFWYILWDPQGRALHDRILGTVVVCE